MKKSFHLIGIGGIGMSGIARIMLENGYLVTGSDLKPSKITDELESRGAKIFIGHSSVNIKDQETVVYSSAISQDNPELVEAKNRRRRLLRRAEALAELMQDKEVVAVAGSHGKTTVTSLVSCLLIEADLRPTVAIGGILKNISANARFGQGRYFVAEADESDGSFLCYYPKYCLITNIDCEHLDYYGTFQRQLEAFADFIAQTKDDGCVFFCSDDKNLSALVEKSGKRSVSFGLKGGDVCAANIKIEGLSSEFDCYFSGRHLGRFKLALGGWHNVSNALGVIAFALKLDIDIEILRRALASYQGARRRLDVKFSDNDCTVIDDYAHHPTEISATLKALQGLKYRRLVVVFQPHRYSRTKMLLEDFSRCFDPADYLVITDIYPAGEPEIAGVNSRLLEQRIKEQNPAKEVLYLEKGQIVGHIFGLRKPGDLIVFLGAGDIVKSSDELAEKVKDSKK